MSKPVWWSVVSVVSAVAVGCRSDGQLVGELSMHEGATFPSEPEAPPPGPATQTDVIVQAAAPQVDVLWTIDNSGSMENEQQALVDNFASFMQYFLGSGLDYHIGVVSTDMDDPAHGGRLQSGGTAYRFIDTDTPDAIGVFTAMASLGTDGSWVECGLHATFEALETLADTSNAGFRRDEASMHTIVVSDEADGTDPVVLTEDEFVVWYSGLEETPEDRTFSSVVDLARGTAYASATAGIGGILWDIQDTVYAQVLDELGIQAAGLQREFFLSQMPVPETIEVSVEDPAVGTLEFVAGDWTYDPARNSVTFVAYVPGELARIFLHYEVQDPGILTIH